ncbi:MAG: DNA alkylation repair protein [Gammaproteobacteria bacterium]|nr:DNA alkylation repair protein [Gammaproteobacteria bacterium]MCZ6852503.1 DNA alkylation repair protein [Gammaproteobacteria bacterium]
MSAATIARIRQALLFEFDKEADPERALQQQAYMKSAMPYLGIMMPVLRSAAKSVFKAHPIDDPDSWHDTALAIWRKARYREERYAAIDLVALPRYRKWLTPDSLPMLEEFIVTGAWWDYVDGIATRFFGHLLTNYPEALSPLLWAWAEDENIWRRRTAILAQLKYKTRTDEKLLFHALEASMDEKEFFLEKAIGWALREYSKSCPEVVIDYVEKHGPRLSNLSKREALKVLRKQGLA